MKKIYFLRHGHSTFTGKYVGSTDCPLSVQGIDQIVALAKKNPFSSVKNVISSPMVRCVQTYEKLGYKKNDTNLKVKHEENLREIDFGLWEGLDFQQVYSTYRKEFDKWCTAPQEFCFPDGEALIDFEKRLAQIPEYLKRCTGDTLVVAHGGVIRHLLCLFLGFPSLSAMKFQIDVAHYAVIDVFDEDCILNALNHG